MKPLQKPIFPVRRRALSAGRASRDRRRGGKHMQRRNVLKGLALTAVAAAPALAQGTAATAAPSTSPSSWPAPQLASGGRLDHCRVGDGPAVCVVLHEWLGDHVNWEQVLPYLDPARHTFVFMDLR